MSLVKKSTISEKEIAANRTNGSLSQGPATLEGKARMGAARPYLGLIDLPGSFLRILCLHCTSRFFLGTFAPDNRLNL